jgi:hypothetical protein
MKVQATAEDEVHVIPDGAVVRVPLFAMDARQRSIASAPLPSPTAELHRPGFASLPAADTTRRMDGYDAADQHLSDRWRAPLSPARREEPRASGDKPALLDTYARRDKVLSERWRAAR